MARRNQQRRRRLSSKCVEDFLDLEAKRKIGNATLKSFRKFLCGNPQRNPNGDFSPTLLEFAAKQNPAITYLQDFTTDLLTNFRGEWRVQLSRYPLRISSIQSTDRFHISKTIETLEG